MVFEQDHILSPSPTAILRKLSPRLRGRQKEPLPDPPSTLPPVLHLQDNTFLAMSPNTHHHTLNPSVQPKSGLDPAPFPRLLAGEHVVKGVCGEDRGGEVSKEC